MNQSRGNKGNTECSNSGIRARARFQTVPGLTAAALFLCLFLAVSTWAEAAPAQKFEPFVPTDPILPLSQVKPGMRGEARTVIRGTQIVTFPVEILEVIPNNGHPKHLILIKASGKVIEETGGIASGMSGSPVYVRSRLVGAIGYGWNFTRHDMGLVTPIEDMMALWDNPERIPSFAPAPVIPEKPPVPATSGDNRLFARSGDAIQRAVSEDAVSIDIVPASGDMPDSRNQIEDMRSNQIFVNGMSPRMAESIGEILGKKVIPLGSGSAEGQGKKVRYNAQAKPGMAIGAALAWGDVEISALGTFSAVAKDGRFVAFAHPFMTLGNTSAALTEATVARVIPGVESPFKLGSTGDIIGIITQDRPQGIGGRIGTFAPAASCTIHFKDVDAARAYKRSFQMVQSQYQMSQIASTAIVGCVENLWGRQGGGSAKITTTFYGSALPNGWKRTNVFVSERDVTREMLKEFTMLTQLFAVNQFQELRPFGIDVDVEMTQDPRVLYVEDVEVPPGPFRPGDRVSFDITLRPWRKAPFVRSYSLVIPQNVSGICELLVRGGGIAEENAEYMEAGWRSISSLPILLKELDAKETNDQIVLEIRGQEALQDQINRARNAEPADLINDKLKSETRAEKMKEGSMRVIRTNYYVDGLIHRLIRVEAPPGQGEPQG